MPKRVARKPARKTETGTVTVVVASERVIRQGEAYTLAEFQRRTGLGETSIKRMQRKGFRTITVGRTKQILGSDYLEYLARHAAEDHG